jgi:UDP-glucose 4-epimerase
MLTHLSSSAVHSHRVVILGAGGFLAPEIRRVLEGERVPVVVVGSEELDLTKPEAGEQLRCALRPDDSVVMVAGLTPDKGRDVATLMKNLRMGESVCAAIGHGTPSHLVYISSDAVYDARSALVLNEDSTCEPTDLYALMHIAREKMLAETCRTSGIAFTVVRPCAIYGPGDTHNSYGPNRFMRTAWKEGKITLFGHGEERRHHVHVTDVASIIRLCLLHRSRGTINAITGTAVSFRELADMVVAAVGRGVAIECLPRTTAITHREFDVTALTNAFPNYSPIPLPSGIARSVAFLSST